MIINPDSKVAKTIEFLRGRKRAYTLTFRQPHGQEVLADLAKFCRATETAFHADPRVHAALEGRREVWLRIQNHLGLSSEELFAVANGGRIKFHTEGDE